MKNCRLGIKLKDFENFTEEYGDDTSAELSITSTDVEMLSPMRNKSDAVEIEKLTAALRQYPFFFKAKICSGTDNLKSQSFVSYRVAP